MRRAPLPALAALAAALVLASCSTAPGRPEPPRKPAYYSDDGPPEKVPEDLASIPDAVPREEPYHRFANRPYTVFGRTYVPVVNDEARRERGPASWYGRKFHGQKTASGEPYDMFAMTAAHKTLPLPSYARVTNVKTGRSVVVRVNDRGPFHEDRVIDLSYAAAARIGIAGPGSGIVEVERVFAGRDAAPALASAAPPRPAEAAAPGAGTVATPLASAPPVVAAAQAPVPAPAAAIVQPEPGGLWVQLGAFASLDNAESFVRRIAPEMPWLLEPIGVAARDGLHRVRLGPYRSRDEALAIAEKVRASLGLEPLVSAR